MMKRRSIKELDAEMDMIKIMVDSGKLNITDHHLHYDDTNGYDQELKWYRGVLPMANIEISQGGVVTIFRVHEFTFDHDERRTMKKQRMVTQSFNEAIDAIQELLS